MSAEETPPAPAPAPPKPPAPAAPKGPAKSMQQIEVDETKVPNLWFTRREFLSLTAWGCVFAGLGASVLAVLRYVIPQITYDPPSIFKIGKPEEYVPGEVTERLKKRYRIWVCRDGVAEGAAIYVIFARCTHLGCTPNWLEGQKKFKCPCHGSGFRRTGINFEGPAPRPL